MIDDVGFLFWYVGERPSGGQNSLKGTPTGSLTLANSYRYESWGRPTTTTHNGVGDLGFRFLYVGEFDVQWDDQLGLGLLYMHARHYSPALGRFLQPDPDRSDANLYAYAANDPLTELDPDGTCFILCVIIVGALLFGSLEATAEVTRYAIHTPQRRWTASGAGRAAREGFVSGAIAGAIPGVGRAFGRPLARGFTKLLARVPRAARVLAKNSRPPRSTKAIREVISSWDKGTFKSRAASIRYHHARHGNGRSLEEYTRAARRFADENRASFKLTPPSKPTYSPSLFFRKGRQGGHYTTSWRILSYWD